MGQSWGGSVALLATDGGRRATRGSSSAPGLMAPGGYLRFSDDLAMVVDGVMLEDSVAAVAAGIPC